MYELFRTEVRFLDIFTTKIENINKRICKNSLNGFKLNKKKNTHVGHTSYLNRKFSEMFFLNNERESTLQNIKLYRQKYHRNTSSLANPPHI